MSITRPSKAEIALTLLASRLTRRSRYRGFIEGIGLRGDERVLDFGAGWGDGTMCIAKSLDKGGRVTALDISPEWQEVIRKRLKGYRNVDFVDADIRSSGLPDASFDIIVISNVIHDMPPGERAPTVRELARKLRPNGRIELRERTGERHGMPVEEIRSLMAGVHLCESCSKSERGGYIARFIKGKQD